MSKGKNSIGVGQKLFGLQSQKEEPNKNIGMDITLEPEDMEQ